MLEPSTRLSSVPVGTSVATVGALNSRADEPQDGWLACDEVNAHFDQTAGWYHRFGYYGGWYSYCPSEVSSAKWPMANLASENEHRTNNYTGPHNIQSQPGPCSLVPGAWGGPNSTGYVNTRTDLPYQMPENIENTDTYPKNKKRYFTYWNIDGNENKYKKSSDKSSKAVCAQTAPHINPNPNWEATENDWVSTNPITQNNTQNTYTNTPWSDNHQTNPNKMWLDNHQTHTHIWPDSQQTHIIGPDSQQTHPNMWPDSQNTQWSDNHPTKTTHALEDGDSQYNKRPNGPKQTVRENIYGSGHGGQRQDDDINTIYNTPYQCVIPTYRYTDIYNRSFHKKSQCFQHCNKLTQACSRKAKNQDMLIIEDSPDKKQKEKKQKTKASCTDVCWELLLT